MAEIGSSFRFLPTARECRGEGDQHSPMGRQAIRSLSARSQVAGGIPARHGRGHKYPAHAINYRANLWAMKSLGVKRSSLLHPWQPQPHIKPGDSSSATSS